MTALQQPEQKETSLNTDGEKGQRVKEKDSERFNEFSNAGLIQILQY